MKVDRMGVAILTSHLLITIAIIGVYAYTLVSGVGDETLKTILTVIIGYWFGSMGVNNIRPTQSGTSVQHADRVEVVSNETTNLESKGGTLK